MKRSKKLWVALAILVALPFETKAKNIMKEVTQGVRKQVSVEAQVLANIGGRLQDDEFGTENLTPFWINLYANGRLIAFLWPMDPIRFNTGKDIWFLKGLDPQRVTGYPLLFVALAYDDSCFCDEHYVGVKQWRVDVGNDPVFRRDPIRLTEIERVDGGYFDPYSMPPVMIYRDGPLYEATVSVSRVGMNGAAIVQYVNNKKAEMLVRENGKTIDRIKTGHIFFKEYEMYSSLRSDTKLLDFEFRPTPQSPWRRAHKEIYVPPIGGGIQGYQEIFGAYNTEPIYGY